MPLCPSCHSEIGTWLNDPIKTPLGLNGEDYIGITFLNGNHIIELQNMRRLQEEEAGIPENERTEFTEVNINGENWHVKHINELRLSTEKILIANAVYVSGSGGRADLLFRYFNYDADDNYIGGSKEEWTDVDEDNLPNLPSNQKIKIKAIHIEELRCPIPNLEGIEYPGTGFIRRYTTLYLNSVYTDFNSWDGNSASLSQGDTIRFTSDFSVENTEIWYESKYTYKDGSPGFEVQGWTLSGNISSLLATIGINPNISFIGVGASITGTDGLNLYHYYSLPGDLDPITYEEIDPRIDVWELASEPDISIQVIRESAEGPESVYLEAHYVDTEIAPSIGWTSFYIWKIIKNATTVEFNLFPGYDKYTQWIGGPPSINPAPINYTCIKIGNGSPEEYWQAYNAEYGTDRSEDYIGYVPITVILSPTHVRKYCNWGYYESAPGAPIRAEYVNGNKTIVYTCNIA